MFLSAFEDKFLHIIISFYAKIPYNIPYNTYKNNKRYSLHLFFIVILKLFTHPRKPIKCYFWWNYLSFSYNKLLLLMKMLRRSLVTFDGNAWDLIFSDWLILFLSHFCISFCRLWFHMVIFQNLLYVAPLVLNIC